MDYPYLQPATCFLRIISYLIKQYLWANTYNTISQFLIKRNKKHHEQNQNTMWSYPLLLKRLTKFFLKHPMPQQRIKCILHFTFDFLLPYFQRISINKESQGTSKVLCDSPIHKDFSYAFFSLIKPMRKTNAKIRHKLPQTIKS